MTIQRDDTMTDPPVDEGQAVAVQEERYRPRDPNAPPSNYALEQAMITLVAARQRLLNDDPDILNDERLFSDMLEGESGNAMDVLDQVVRAAIIAENMEDAARVMQTDLATRVARFAARKNTLRGIAFAAMESIGTKKLERPDFTASIRNGQPSVIITDADAVPDAYVRLERKLDKTAIAAALKAGETVPGAEYSNGLASITIRTK